jgi:hypothetical protein
MNIHQAIAEGLAEELAQLDGYGWYACHDYDRWQVELRFRVAADQTYSGRHGPLTLELRPDDLVIVYLDTTEAANFHYEDPGLIRQIDQEARRLYDHWWNTRS